MATSDSLEELSSADVISAISNIDVNVSDYGAVGDDVADDTTAIQDALDDCPSGGIVYLPPGQYRTTAPLVVPPNITFRGSHSSRVTYSNSIQIECYIKPKSSFVGDACIRFKDKEEASYTAENVGIRLENIHLDGTALTSGTVDGIKATGYVRDVKIQGVSIRGFRTNGIRTTSYTRLNASSYSPYSWYLSNVIADTNGNIGYSFNSFTDATLIDCHAIANTAYGFYIGGNANCQFTSCRAEWNGSHGFYITGSSNGASTFSNCSTDRNDGNGFLVDSSNKLPLNFNGLMLRRDGRSGGSGGGSYAGFNANGATAPIIVNGLTVLPGVDDDNTGTNSPQYGFRATGNTYVSLNNAYLHAAATGFSDGGTNTVLKRGNHVSEATGTISSPTRSLTNTLAVGSGMSFVVAASDAPNSVRTNANYVCDGTADNVEIQAAIDAVSSAGGSVILSSGTFTLAAKLQITSSHTTLKGQGNSTILILANSVNDNVLNITGSGVIEVKIKMLRIDGNKSNQTNCDGIYVSTAWTSNTNDTQHVFEDLQILNCKNNGFEVAASSDTRVLEFNRVRIRKCDGNGWYLPAPSCTDCTFYDCIAETIALNGFYIGCLNSHFTDCKTFYCGSAGGSTHGFNILGYNNYFTSCEAQDNYQSGFYGDGSLGDSTYHNQYNTFVNCIADSNGQNGGSTYAVGMQLISCTGWQIIGGLFMTRPYPSFTQRIGISLEGTTTGTIITNVLGTGNSSALYSDTSSGSNHYVTPKVKQGIAKISGGAQQYGVPGTAFNSTGTTALTINEDRYVPFTVNYPIKITAHQFEVTTGPSGAANVRVGIYLADTDLQPSGAPLYDSGSVAVANGFTGLKTTSSLSVTLTPGNYLVAINCDVTMTLRTLTSPSPMAGASMGTSPMIQRVGVGRTYAAFPTPGTKWTTPNTSGGGLQHSVIFQWTE